jgi:replicative DNA helicase
MVKNKLFDDLLEQDVIGYLLDNSHLTIEVSKILNEESFSNALFKQVFKAMVELNSFNSVFTRYDVFRVLKGEKKRSNVAIEKVLKIHPNRVFDLLTACLELKELENKRIINDLYSKVSYAMEANEEVSTIVSLIENKLEEVTTSSASSEVFSISDLYDKVVDRMDEMAGVVKFSGIDTGSRNLNYMTGGWQEGMSVIAARPGMGKTIAGLEHAKAGARVGKKVLFLSLEMPKESLIYRYISSEITEYAYSDLKANKISKADVAKIRASNAKDLKQLPIYFYDSDNRDINYLSLMLTAECRKNKIDFVVIDYMQLIRDIQIKDQGDFAQVSSVSNKIQKLSRKLKIPIICLSQLSREIEKRSNRLPQLSDLRSSGNIEQDAILVIGLYRDDYYKYTDAKANNVEPAKMDNKLTYVILKNRDGGVGDIDRYCDVRTNRIVDSEVDLFHFAKPEVLFKETALDTMKPTFDDKVVPF